MKGLINNKNYMKLYAAATNMFGAF